MERALALALPDGVKALPARPQRGCYSRRCKAAVHQRAQRLKNLPHCAAVYFSFNLPKPVGPMSLPTYLSNGLLGRLIATLGACFYGYGTATGSNSMQDAMSSHYFTEADYDTAYFHPVHCWESMQGLAGWRTQASLERGSGPALTLIAERSYGAKKHRGRHVRQHHTGGSRRGRRPHRHRQRGPSEHPTDEEPEEPAPPAPSSSTQGPIEVMDSEEETTTRVRRVRRIRGRAILNSSDDVVGYEPLPPSPCHIRARAQRAESPEWFSLRPARDLPMQEQSSRRSHTEAKQSRWKAVDRQHGESTMTMSRCRLTSRVWHPLPR